MTPAQRELIEEFWWTGQDPPTLTNEEFLRRWGAVNGTELGLDLIREAMVSRDPDDLEYAMTVWRQFGLPDANHMLVELAFADWHHQHEDVASALQDLHPADAVEALVHLAIWVPDYLAYDEEARALAVKATWALGAIRTDEADRALEALGNGSDLVVAKAARHQLEPDVREWHRQTGR